ncbi:MAG: hypothetical protein ACREBO_02935 [Novosphingobium sp.]
MTCRPLILLVLPALSGCALASAATTVVTAPVKVASKAVDLATTSQSESDEKRGRELRKREERLGKLEREYGKQSAKCAAGNAEACTRRDAAYAEMQALIPTVPAEPE